MFLTRYLAITALSSRAPRAGITGTWAASSTLPFVTNAITVAVSHAITESLIQSPNSALTSGVTSIPSCGLLQPGTHFGNTLVHLSFFTRRLRLHHADKADTAKDDHKNGRFLHVYTYSIQINFMVSRFALIICYILLSCAKCRF